MFITKKELDSTVRYINMDLGLEKTYRVRNIEDLQTQINELKETVNVLLSHLSLEVSNVLAHKELRTKWMVTYGPAPKKNKK